jgi:hypothetical protein
MLRVLSRSEKLARCRHAQWSAIGFARDEWSSIVNSIKTLTIAALLSVVTASSAFAQAAIQEPGEFSFYYPNRDVLNGGAPLWSDPATMRTHQERQSGMAHAFASVPRHRIYKSASRPLRGRASR